jgi:hypothetical protein
MATAPLDLGQMRLSSTRKYNLTLRDSAGNVVNLAPVTSYTALLSPGSGLPAVATLSAATLSAVGGLVTLTIDDSAVAGLIAGTYQVFVTAYAGGEPIAAPTECVIELVDGAGTAPAASGTLTYAEVEAHSGSLITAAFGAADLPKNFVGGHVILGPIIAQAMRWVGLDPTGLLRPTDADCLGLTGSNIDEFRAVAVYEGLDAAILAFVQVPWASGSQRQELDRFKAQAMQHLAIKGERLKAMYGYGAATLTAGSIGLGFVAGDPAGGEF